MTWNEIVGYGVMYALLMVVAATMWVISRR